MLAHLDAALDISIHALLAESDQIFGGQLVCHGHISIHALLAESDLAIISDLSATK